MSAPFFTSASALQCDLRALQYPHADNPASVQAHGRARLATLVWLAQQLDATIPCDIPAETLAAFWDAYDIHSHPPTGGNQIPFSSSRARDAPLAAGFLRACIDVVAAARRMERLESGGEGGEKEGEKEGEKMREEFDQGCMKHLKGLIEGRHLLFPNTVRMLEVPKRRALRPRGGNGTRGGRGRGGGGGGVKRDTLPTRRALISRIREMKGVRDGCSDVIKSNEGLQHADCETGCADDEVVKATAKEGECLRHLISKVERVARTALEGEQEKAGTENAAWKEGEEEQNNEVAKRCDMLHGEVSTMLHSLQAVRRAERLIKETETKVEGIITTSALISAIQEERQRCESHNI